MKDLNLWDQILLSLRFNDSIGHNIFLAISILLTVGFILSLLARIISLFSNPYTYKNTTKKRSKFAFIMAGFWMLIFPWGLFLGIDVSLTHDSDAAALDRAFIYEVNGKTVATTVVGKFVANSSGPEGTTGSTFYKIQAVELESGKVLFDKKLKGSKSFDRDVKILTDSKDNLFLFYNGQILVVDKKTGETNRAIESVNDSNDILLLPAPEMCKFDTTTQSVVFKANNGLVYSLDISNLSIEEKNKIDAGKYFESEKDSASGKYLGMGIEIDKALQNDDFNMFLTDLDIKNIREGLEVSSSSKNTERRFLYRGKLDNLNELKKISQEVFLSGGFLYKESSDDKPVYSSIDDKNKNFRNYENISYRGEAKGVEPLRVEDSKLSFIVHRKSLDTWANILLTAMDLQEGRKAWTLDTGASEIRECYTVDKGHILLLCSSKSGSSMGDNLHSNFILYVSVKDGTFTGFDFKNNRCFKS